MHFTIRERKSFNSILFLYSGRRIRVPHRPADLQRLHHASKQWDRHHLRGCRLGSGEADAEPPGSVRRHGARVPTSTDGHSRLSFTHTHE